MKGLILSGGTGLSCERLSAYASEADFILCADSGAENTYHCKIMPDELAGDFDSLDPDVLAFYRELRVPIQEYSSAKDLTDTQLAAEICIAKGCTELIITGATGDRTDHLLGNLWLLLWLRDIGVEGQIISETEKIILCKKRMELHAPVGTVVSLLPLSPQVTGVTLQGLEYPLQDAVLDMRRPISISNVFESATALVEFERGELLVIMQV